MRSFGWLVGVVMLSSAGLAVAEPASRLAAANARHDAVGTRLWKSIRQRGVAHTRDDGTIEFIATKSGVRERAGYYGGGLQVQREIEGKNGHSLRQVINFGDSLRTNSVTHSIGGHSLDVSMSPGRPVSHGISGDRGYRTVTAAEAKGFRLTHGSFEPAIDQK